MAKITVSHEMERQYPEFRGRFGESVDAKEFQEAHKQFLKQGREEAAGADDEADTEAKPAEQSGEAGKTDGDAGATTAAPKPATAPRRRASAGAKKSEAKK